MLGWMVVGVDFEVVALVGTLSSLGAKVARLVA
jgi:hypothetical protein